MTRSKRRTAPRCTPKPAQSREPQKPPIQFLPPLRPRPVLTVVLGLILLAWLIILIILRIKTVAPH